MVWSPSARAIPMQCSNIWMRLLAKGLVPASATFHSVGTWSGVPYPHGQLAESTTVSLTHASTDLVLEPWQLALQKKSQPANGVQPESQWEFNGVYRFHHKAQKSWSATHSHMSSGSPHVASCCLQKEIHHSMYELHSLLIVDVACFHSNLNHWMFQSPKNDQSFSIFLDLQLAFPKPCKSHLLFSNNQSPLEAWRLLSKLGGS